MFVKVRCKQLTAVHIEGAWKIKMVMFALLSTRVESWEVLSSW